MPRGKFIFHDLEGLVGRHLEPANNKPFPCRLADCVLAQTGRSPAEFEIKPAVRYALQLLPHPFAGKRHVAYTSRSSLFETERPNREKRH